MAFVLIDVTKVSAHYAMYLRSEFYFSDIALPDKKVRFGTMPLNFFEFQAARVPIACIILIV